VRACRKSDCSKRIAIFLDCGMFSRMSCARLYLPSKILCCVVVSLQAALLARGGRKKAANARSKSHIARTRRITPPESFVSAM